MGTSTPKDTTVEKQCVVCLNYFWDISNAPKLICRACNGLLDKLDVEKFK